MFHPQTLLLLPRSQCKSDGFTIFRFLVIPLSEHSELKKWGFSHLKMKNFFRGRTPGPPALFWTQVKSALGKSLVHREGGNRGVLRTSTQRGRYTYGLAVWPYKELLTHAQLTRLIHYSTHIIQKVVMPSRSFSMGFFRPSSTPRHHCKMLNEVAAAPLQKNIIRIFFFRTHEEVMSIHWGS